ncbi:MAG TPA: RIP metalloprotease RseP [Haloplasmataceae bacterium]
MSFIIYILIFLLVLGLVVLVHEFGHFVFAKRAGILCHEFSIGMGPALYKIKKNETVYAIRAIPLGGYVAMAGEDPETEKIKKGQVVYLQMENAQVKKIYLYKPQLSNVTYAKIINYDLYGKDNKNLFIEYVDLDGTTHHVTVNRDAYYQIDEKNELQIAPFDRCFESKPWLSRFMAVIAGALFNFILATIIFLIINLVTGVPVSDPIIADVSNNSPAALSGLQKGDKIISIKMQDKVTTIHKWSDISKAMDYYVSGDITITVLRNNQEYQYTLSPEIYIGTIGIGSGSYLESTKIGYIQANSNADKAGLKVGDVIKRISGTLNEDENTEIIEKGTVINETNLTNWDDLNKVFSKFYLAEKITIVVDRDGVEKTITVQAIKAIESKNVSSPTIGIIQGTEHNLFKAIGKGFTDTFEVIGSVFATLGLLFGDRNVGVGDLSGPVGIYDMTKTFAMAGFTSLLFWIGFISANIGFVNLLPLPALDGGRLIFLLIEGIARKPINRKVEGYIHTVGFILFMLLFLYVTFNDIIRIRG